MSQPRPQLLIHLTMKPTLQSFSRATFVLVVASLLASATTSCSPKGSSQLEAANRYFAAGEYDKAEIEYKNALQATKGQSAHAIARLGLIYLDEGRIRQSVPYLLKARELQPENLEVRNKLGMLYVSSGKFKEAREEAEYILTRKPTDEDAPIIFVESSFATPAEIDAARERLKQLPGGAADGAPVITALGLIELRQKNLPAAEAAFQRALKINPKSSAAYSALATVYLVQQDKAKLGEALKSAAEVAPIRSGKMLQYGQFKLQAGDKAGARQILEDLKKKAPDYLPAQSLLAEIAASEKRYDDSAALVAGILAKEPGHPEALLLSGRLKLARGEPDKAIGDFENVLKVYPTSPQALYFLGLAYTATGDKIKAVDRLNQAIKISPMPEAILALAGVNLRNGDYGAVVTGLKPFVQKHPENIQARMMLADAYRAQGNTDDALAMYRLSEKDFPTNPQTSFQTGLTLLYQKKTAEARIAFTEALQRSPGFQPALEQLVNMDIADKQYETAIQRITPELARDPKSPFPHLLLGRIYAVQRNTQQAETEFLKAIELRPEIPTGYFQLAQLYIISNQEQKALASLKSVTDRTPGDLKALLITGLLQDHLKNYAAAREAYEKILVINPKSSVALNNLAYLYSERFNELDKAYETAQKAREQLPEEPHTADTLGWILYKKGQYARGLNLLEESAAGLPNEPDVQYHLGMTRYMMDLEEPARQAFARTLELNKDMPAAPDIRRRLGVLAIDGKSSGAEAVAVLEKSVADSNGDPIALSRLAALYERSGSADKAIASYQAAAAANPTSPRPLMGLARLYASRKDTQKAMDAVKSARKLAPDDSAIARALGSIARQTGDSVWAASLLQEAVRKQPDDPELLFEAAQAVYSVGKISEAQEMAKQALGTTSAPSSTALFKSQTESTFSKSAEAQRFLEMTALAARPDPAAMSKIEDVLKTDPDDLPALMARGAFQEQKSDSAGARLTYEKALTHNKDFPPVKLRLAVLSAASLEFDEKALDWAQQARSAYPNDADAAKALGILTYRKGGDPARAISLLKQSITGRPNDAESLYYLGLAQIQNKDLAPGQQSLRKAIESGLRADLATKAREALDAK